MIEFTIPLNLPIRAVEITDTKTGPSARLQREMTLWAEGYFGGSAVRNNSSQSITAMSDQSATKESPRTDAGPRKDDLQHERESLQQQQKRFVEATQELQRITRSVEKQLEGLILPLQEAAVELGHAIAAKLIFEEVDAGRFPIANLVHEVVSRLDTSASSVVRLHPDDLALVQELPEIDGQGEERSVRFVADSTLARGDCKAKAGEITVIYELRRQIEEIRRQLLSTVSGHAET